MSRGLGDVYKRQLSEENRKDIAEIKADYIAGLTFHYVKTNEEVLQLALE